MKTLTVAEFQSDFSEVLQALKSGEEIAVSYRKNMKPFVFLYRSIHTIHKNQGIINGKLGFAFAIDFRVPACSNVTKQEIANIPH